MPSIMAGQIGTSNLPPLYENVAAASAKTVHGGLPSGLSLSPGASESQNLNRFGAHMAGNALQPPLVDPMYLEYLRMTEYAAAAQAAALHDPSMHRNYLVGNSQMDYRKLILGLYYHLRNHSMVFPWAQNPVVRITMVTMELLHMVLVYHILEVPWLVPLFQTLLVDLVVL